jgi:hypothetical protein
MCEALGSNPSAAKKKKKGNGVRKANISVCHHTLAEDLCEAELEQREREREREREQPLSRQPPLPIFHSTR